MLPVFTLNTGCALQPLRSERYAAHDCDDGPQDGHTPIPLQHNSAHMELYLTQVNAIGLFSHMAGLHGKSAVKKKTKAPSIFEHL